ncbi:hypothetical protein [Sphingomonas sp. MMS24-J13]|uniref:hypothetical protein n=1 Tax=Sphingomonas sp. MMS24-J13 TaxID=3238686 RepID=UPI00384F763C
MIAAFFALASGLWPFGTSQTSTQHFQVPAWNIRVTRDKFTQDRTCLVFQGRQRKPMVSYAHGAVTFQFASHLNTTEASFKIDNGPVRAWDDVYPALVQTGARLEGRSLDNPTGGKVMIPLSMLRGAHVVTVRPSPRTRPRSFAIDGLGDVLGSAQGLGCEAGVVTRS